jgi:hypothetical protein
MSDEAKTRAEAVFKIPSPESRSVAMAAYRAEQQAALVRMAERREARLAQKAAGTEAEAPRR